MIIIGTPCDSKGQFLPSGSKPPASASSIPGNDNPWHPFNNQAHFELADFLFQQNQMPGSQIDDLMHIWASLQEHPQGQPPFANHQHLYQLIDQIMEEEMWQSFEMQHADAHDPSAPPWKQATYQMYLRDPMKLLEQQLSNPELKDFMDYAPSQVFGEKDQRVWSNFMTGNWAWHQCNELAEQEENHGAMFVPVILASDKTVVSVATGQNEYWPIYITTGNVHNSARRAHGQAVSLLGFLSIPKSDKEHESDSEFRKFRHHLFQTSLKAALEKILPAMTKHKVILCADGHYRRAIFGIGPYIGDYPEQALLACIVQGWCPKCTAHRSSLDSDNNAVLRDHEHTKMLLEMFTTQILWREYGIVDDILPFTTFFPRANIHELIAPDILHQIIKGTFKDHLVAWVEAYIKEHYPDSDAILADIDRRIAAVPPFPGLRRFPQGRGFKQWTGNDSKALMKVYLPAIADYLPDEMVQCIASFLDCCYIIRQSSLDEEDLKAFDNALLCFQDKRKIFQDCGVRPNEISIPRIHALQHYHEMIQLFGAPNGLCSSITESKHIQAVKAPWRRTNRHEALHQMLIINQRLDNLAYFKARMLSKGYLSFPSTPSGIQPQAIDIEWDEPEARDDTYLADTEDDNGLHGISVVELAKVSSPRRLRTFTEIGEDIHYPDLAILVADFVQRSRAQAGLVNTHSQILEKAYTFESATAIFCAPSDLCGVGGMQHQRIHATSSWGGGPARYDCVFVEKNHLLPGFQGLYVAQVLLFFSFADRNTLHSCALVKWFIPIEHCFKTGMWMVQPEMDEQDNYVVSVISLDSILRPAHLIPVYGPTSLPLNLQHTDSLSAFAAFYVNKFSDYHAYQLVF
ncbi:hypothetical protein L210DRAFT_3609849 [Boletus edulis BED1]|uniref:Transposase n=1 Tax=Boletus edulis BED1 TaxID=1328754 RepID=A0AAD4C2Z5_BOLED|nr:hypothetical protein L210DRAFT_3609849 [Boletus edulis BED1]